VAPGSQVAGGFRQSSLVLDTESLRSEDEDDTENWVFSHIKNRRPEQGSCYSERI